MNRALRLALWIALLAPSLALAPTAGAPARADGPGDAPGAFAYYVLALSWSPNWCAREGAARGSPQCEPGAGFGWTLHGLWPQHEAGWPAFCRSPHPDPSRAETRAMADAMGGAGLAWHQWDKHGTCSGLSPAAYFALSRRAYRGVAIPDALQRPSRVARLPAAAVEAAFLRANGGLDPDALTVTCRDGMVAEVRLCLTRDLEPRACGADARRDCALPDALMEPVP